jgi:hypothetical protein
MGFCSLQHSKVRKSTGRGRCQHPLRSACRVWRPSWRLTPSEPVPVLFHTGGALGIRPSELSPPERYPPRFGAEEPTYRLTHRCSRRQRRWAGPVGRGFWAFTLPGIPGSRHGVSAAATGCSLGLCPSRVYQQKPCPGSHPDSSHALCRRQPYGQHPPAPRSFDQPPLGPNQHTRRTGQSA